MLLIDFPRERCENMLLTIFSKLIKNEVFFNKNKYVGGFVIPRKKRIPSTNS